MTRANARYLDEAAGGRDIQHFLFQRQVKTVNGHSEFWGADRNYANAMLRGFDGERRLTEVQRPLTSPPALNEVAQPFGRGEH